MTSSSTSLPLDGRLTDLAGFSRLGDEGVDLFLVDSTNAEVPGFVTPEREIGGVLDNVIGKAKQRVIVASFASSRAPHPAGRRRRARVQPPRRRSSVARWSATCRSHRSSATCTVPDGVGRRHRHRRQAARRQARAHLHRIAGRAAVGAVADGARRTPPDQHPRRRSRGAGVVADPGQRELGVRGGQRARQARRHGRSHSRARRCTSPATLRPASCSTCTTRCGPPTRCPCTASGATCAPTPRWPRRPAFRRSASCSPRTASWSTWSTVSRRSSDGFRSVTSTSTACPSATSVIRRCPIASCSARAASSPSPSRSTRSRVARSAPPR